MFRDARYGKGWGFEICVQLTNGQERGGQIKSRTTSIKRSAAPGFH